MVGRPIPLQQGDTPMEIELRMVIEAIFQVCSNGKNTFTPSSVRKMIQRLHGPVARMDAATVSARMQPHFKTLTRCACVELTPTAQQRNRPRRITDRPRLQQLLDAPALVESLISDAIEGTREVADLLDDERTLADSGLSREAWSLQDVRRELLEALEEHASDMQEMISDNNRGVFECLKNIEQQLTSMHARLMSMPQNTEASLAFGHGDTDRTSTAYTANAPLQVPTANQVAGSVEARHVGQEAVLIENLPAWLQAWQPSKKIAVTDFFASRVVFYPGSGTDGQPVAFFGSGHLAHCFVYADYGMTREHVTLELGDAGHPFAGYVSIGRQDLLENDLTPHGWVPHILPAGAVQGSLATVRPYAFIEILERRSGFGEGHGPQRLAVLILCADGVAAYDSLFCQPRSTLPFAVVLQDHGWGGNWTTFGQGGCLDSLVSQTLRLPEYLLVAENTDAWQGYIPVEGMIAGGGGMHGFNRQLWCRANQVEETALENVEVPPQTPILTADACSGSIIAAGANQSIQQNVDQILGALRSICPDFSCTRRGDGAWICYLETGNLLTIRIGRELFLDIRSVPTNLSGFKRFSQDDMPLYILRLQNRFHVLSRT